ncbi:WbqC family protein [Metasolibacillus fluoroglycofenilyticus]|uniref:WbqC family protein n=1 Tax=Metasolibacillus fluoroglycofenilyticus TaxID=1239396 RepID=UPI000D37EA6D|nr:WbqC family protein [Metasolibacillus fluoroglycofenilyticus]
MKVAIMQPYFFPYLGYFSLIKNTDQFILFDTVQYMRHGWIERNRILKPQEGWQYVQAPLMKHSKSTSIKDIQIKNEDNWKERIIRQLEHYKKKAPYYNEVISVVRLALELDTDSIVKLNENILKVVCAYIGIDLSVKVFSEMDITIKKVHAPDEWALNICESLGGIQEYWNPQGGIEFFNRKKYSDAGLTINFLKINLESYSQKRRAFEAGLSIIDVMMFNSPEEIRKMLDNYELI